MAFRANPLSVMVADYTPNNLNLKGEDFRKERRCQKLSILDKSRLRIKATINLAYRPVVLTIVSRTMKGDLSSTLLG